MSSKLVSIFCAAAGGAVIIFLFGFVMFNVVPAPKWYTQAFPADHSALAGLKTLETGTYQYPNPSPRTQEEMDATVKLMEEGPVFTLYLRGGPQPGMGMAIMEEFLRAFLAAVVVSYLLSITYSSFCCYSHRVFFVAMCGCFAAVSCETTYSIWFFRTCGTTTWMYIATIGGWTLAGFAIARLVKPWNKVQEK